MKKGYAVLVFLLACCGTLPAAAQLTLGKGDQTLEIKSYIKSFYNYRFYQPGETDLKKNRFEINDAQLEIKGRRGRNFKFSLKTNLVTLVNGNPTDGDSPLMDADITFESSHNGPSIELGFDKVPYSRSANMNSFDMPFFNRAEIASGDVFARRDVGITVTQSFLSRRVNLYAGIYNGLGEESVLGDNDASGNPEFLGRLEVCYPAYVRDVEVDYRNTPIPTISIAANARYTKKQVDGGVDYGVKTVNGEKLTMGMDAILLFRGFSAQFEMHRVQVTPKDTTRLMGLPTEYFNVLGYLVQANYYCKKISSVFAVRYDAINPNDLILGDTYKSLNFGYNFIVPSSPVTLKAQYMHRLNIEGTNTPWKEHDLRVGAQIVF